MSSFKFRIPRNFGIQLSSYHESSDDKKCKLLISYGYEEFLDTFIHYTISKTFKLFGIEFNNPFYIHPYGKLIENIEKTNIYLIAQKRTFGFTLNGEFLIIFHGIDESDSSIDQYTTFNLGWRDTTYVRWSLLNLDGSRFVDIFNKKLKIDETWEHREECEKSVPNAIYKITDFDDEIILATCHLYEIKHEKGSGLFSWLKYFYLPNVYANIQVEYSKPQGKRKNTFKGGYNSSSAPINKNQHIDINFKEFAFKNDIRHFERIN